MKVTEVYSIRNEKKVYIVQKSGTTRKEEEELEKPKNEGLPNYYCLPNLTMSM